MKFTLLLFCIFAYLLLFFVAGSSSGVANLCEEGKFFDSSKQKYKSCLECKSDMQECYSCCQTEVHGGEKNNSSTPILRHQVTDKPGLHDGKPRVAEGDKSLPNIFVVSTISVFLISSLLVLVLVVIRSSLERRVEARESTSMSRQSQQSSPVIEIMTTHAQLLVQRDDASEGDAANEGDVASEGNVRLDNTYYVDAVMCR